MSEQFQTKDHLVLLSILQTCRLFFVRFAKNNIALSIDNWIRVILQLGISKMPNPRLSLAIYI